MDPRHCPQIKTGHSGRIPLTLSRISLCLQIVNSQGFIQRYKSTQAFCRGKQNTITCVAQLVGEGWPEMGRHTTEELSCSNLQCWVLHPEAQSTSQIASPVCSKPDQCRKWYGNMSITRERQGQQWLALDICIPPYWLQHRACGHAIPPHHHSSVQSEASLPPTTKEGKYVRWRDRGTAERACGCCSTQQCVFWASGTWHWPPRLVGYICCATPK